MVDLIQIVVLNILRGPQYLIIILGWLRNNSEIIFDATGAGSPPGGSGPRGTGLETGPKPEQIQQQLVPLRRRGRRGRRRRRDGRRGRRGRRPDPSTPFGLLFQSARRRPPVGHHPPTSLVGGCRTSSSSADIHAVVDFCRRICNSLQEIAPNFE